MTPFDRRMFERVRVNFPAQISDFQRSPISCYDISAGGVSVISREKLIPVPNLEIALQIPDGAEALHKFARVVWSKQIHENKWRSGLEFKDIDFLGLRRAFPTRVEED